ncbi:MAG: hypothetical protein ACYTG0_46715 [Planctomycetota bacterium]|jgi:hypothetical protein
MSFKYDADEIVVECNSSGNNQIYYLPLDIVHRGRWDDGRVQITTNRGGEAVKAGTIIPGIHLALSVSKRRFRVRDPIHESRELQRLLLKINGQPEDTKINFDQVEVLKKDMPDDDLATHWHWMKRLVDIGQATIVQGKFGDKRPKGRVLVNRSPSSRNFPYDRNTKFGEPRFEDEFNHLLGRNQPQEAVDGSK